MKALKTTLFLLGFSFSQLVNGQDINAEKLQGTWFMEGDEETAIIIEDSTWTFVGDSEYKFEYSMVDIHRNQISILHHYATLFGEQDTIWYTINRVTENELYLTNRESEHGHVYFRKK